MDTDATNEGVSQEEQTQLVKDAKDNANSSRLDAMQELAANRRETRDADLEEAGHEVIDTSIDPDKEPETLDVAPEEEAAPEKKEEFRTLKVDGEDKEFSLEKILDAGTRTLQKESAADARLEEATRLLKEAQATQPSTDVGQSSEEASTPSSIDAEMLAKTLIDGDQEEVTEAVNKILAAGRTEVGATQDRSDIYGLVQDALNVDKALALFQESPEKGGFSDLYGNEMLRGMVMDEEKKLADSGDTRDYSARLADAAKTVRDVRDQMIKDSGATVTGFDDKKDKKLKAENTIEGAGGRETKAGNDAPKSRAQVRKDSLEKMASSRGQQID